MKPDKPVPAACTSLWQRLFARFSGHMQASETSSSSPDSLAHISFSRCWSQGLQARTSTELGPCGPQRYLDSLEDGTNSDSVCRSRTATLPLCTVNPRRYCKLRMTKFGNFHHLAPTLSYGRETPACGIINPESVLTCGRAKAGIDISYP